MSTDQPPKRNKRRKQKRPVAHDPTIQFHPVNFPRHDVKPRKEGDEPAD